MLSDDANVIKRELALQSTLLPVVLDFHLDRVHSAIVAEVIGRPDEILSKEFY